MLHEVKTQGVDDGLSVTQRELDDRGLPEMLRIPIPIRALHNYVQMAGLLDQLANVLRLHGRLNSEPERRRITEAYFEGRMIARKLSELGR